MFGFVKLISLSAVNYPRPNAFIVLSTYILRLLYLFSKQDRKTWGFSLEHCNIHITPCIIEHYSPLFEMVKLTLKQTEQEIQLSPICYSGFPI